MKSLDNEKIAYYIEAGKRKSPIILAVLLMLGALWLAWSQYRDNATTQGKNEELTAQLANTAAQLDNATTQLETTKEKLKKTEEDLSYANDQVKLLEDTTAALNRQVSGLSLKKADLERRIKNLIGLQPSKPKITRKELEEQVTAIGELATLKYIYTNSTRSEGDNLTLWGWKLPFTDSSILVTYDGTIKAGITLSEIKFDVNESSRTITVTLPKSSILDNYIPQETINVLEVKDGLFNPVTFDDYNKFIAEEKQVMAKKATDMGILTDADKEAKATIEAFLKGIPGMDTYQLIVK